MSNATPAIPVRMDVYRTAIPMRGFEHAAASREVAEAVVVRVEFAEETGTGSVFRRLKNGACPRFCGWGETLPRPYVTGETIESVLGDLREVFWPAMAGRAVRPEDVAKIAAQAAADGRCRNAAACAVELALFINRAEKGTGTISQTTRNGASPLFGETGTGTISQTTAEKGTGTVFQTAKNGASPLFCRVSGVLGSSDPARTARRLRLMRWYGLRDYKLKLGFSDDVDRENLRLVHRQLAGWIGPPTAVRRGWRRFFAGRCTLRVDVNGAWPADSVPDRVRALQDFGVCVVEQPITGPAAALVELAPKCDLPLMADESLLALDDAKVLLQAGSRIWWNIRISKNGGLGPALALCRLASENDVPFTVGCLVGESGILSAAQRRLLEWAPAPRFVEGNYGRFLLADDLTRPSPRFGYGGRLKPLRGAGLGVTVDEGQVRRYGTLVETFTA